MAGGLNGLGLGFSLGLDLGLRMFNLAKARTRNFAPACFLDNSKSCLGDAAQGLEGLRQSARFGTSGRR